MSKSKFNFTDLKFVLLPAKPTKHHPCMTLHNESYLLWKNIWTQVVYKYSKGQAALDQDHFLRQDMVSCLLTPNNEIIAINLNTFFNLESYAAKENPYFLDFNKSVIECFEKEDLKSLHAIEYLTVNPKFRKTITGLPFSETIIGLTLELMKSKHQDACIATPKKEKGLMSIAKNYNGIILQEDIFKYDIHTTLVTFPQKSVRPSPNPLVAQSVEHLWNNRIDFTKITPKQTDVAIAA